MTSEREKMLAGNLYDAGDTELCELRSKAQRFMKSYNQTIVDDGPVRDALLKSNIGAVGESCEIRSPVYVDYGLNIYIGDRVFLNYGCVLLDVCTIHIGSGTQVGPAVQIVTADHPRDPADRAAGLEMGKPINIGENVWIGSQAVILPGVTIGDNAIVGAGSIVTRDVPPGITVVGNPARRVSPAPATSPVD
jgi:maltose O-acetyltransferase